MPWSDPAFRLAYARDYARRYRLTHPHKVEPPTLLIHKVTDLASADRLRERDARLSAPHRDLAGLIFGDPPVGYSALDRCNKEKSS